MTAQSDTDRLMELIEQVCAVSDRAIRGDWGRDGLKGYLAMVEVRNLCTQEMFRWKDADEAHQPIRDAALQPLREEF